MQNKLILPALLIFVGVSTMACGQTRDPFRDMQDVFDRMQRWQQQLQEGSWSQRFESHGGDSSFFYFRIDTTFTSEGGFPGSPFGDQGFGGSFFLDGNSLFQRFFEGSPFEGFFDVPQMSPDMRGRRKESEGELLPEELLRQQEGSPQRKAPPAAPRKSPPPGTIRI
jgi:hypothetical protein